MRIKGVYILSNKLIRTYKLMLKNPNKVWLKHDFRNHLTSMKDDTYFDVLIKLGLIERVPAIYYTGNKKTIARNVKGYKILK